VFFDGKAIRWRPNTKEGHNLIEKSAVHKVNKKKQIILDGGKIVISRKREGKIFGRFKVHADQEVLSFSIKSVKNDKVQRELCL